MMSKFFDRLKYELPVVVRRSNAVLAVVRLFALSPLAVIFGFNLSSYENIVGLIAVIVLGAIWFAIEAYLGRRIPLDDENQMRSWKNFVNCLSEARKQKLKLIIYNKNKLNNSYDLSDYQKVAVFLDSVLYFSVFLSFFRFIFYVLGYDKALSPIALITGFVVIFTICSALALLNHKNEKKILQDFAQQLNSSDNISSVCFKNDKHDYRDNEKQLITGIAYQHEGVDGNLIMQEDRSFNKWHYTVGIEDKKLYDCIWYIFSVVLSVGFYFFIQWVMPFHEVLGAPYVFGVGCSLVLCHLLFELKNNYLGDIIRDAKPFISFGVGVVTADLLINSLVLMITGVSLQHQMMIPWLHTAKYIFMFVFAVALFVAETSDDQSVSADILRNSGRLKFLPKSNIHPGYDHDYKIFSSDEPVNLTP